MTFVTLCIGYTHTHTDIHSHRVSHI